MNFERTQFSTLAAILALENTAIEPNDRKQGGKLATGVAEHTEMKWKALPRLGMYRDEERKAEQKPSSAMRTVTSLELDATSALFLFFLSDAKYTNLIGKDTVLHITRYSLVSQIEIAETVEVLETYSPEILCFICQSALLLYLPCSLIS